MRKLNPDEYLGLRYGRLVILSAHFFHDKRGWYVNCACDCGKQKSIRISNLKVGKTISCGCYNKEVTAHYTVKHGMSLKPIHRIWNSMIDRCYKAHSHAYKNYGARGIYVSPDWHDFRVFYKDMGDRPPGKSLERLDNNGPYSKENCIWAERKAQSRNRRDNKIFEIGGQSKCLAEWCEIYGQNYKRVHQRIHTRGWDCEAALKTPALERSYSRPRPKP